MEDSILTSVKKTLNLVSEYTYFDEELITYINSAFSRLNELGVGPSVGFEIADETGKWSDYTVSPVQLNTVKTYISLFVKLLFDPPTLSFLVESQKQQLEKFEWRLTSQRDWELDPVDPLEEVIP